jgi:uncharacterized protein YjhX (UPF0386 family)
MRVCFTLPAHWEAAIRNRTIVALQAGLVACLLAIPGPAEAAELKPEAVQGFDRYVHLTGQRMQTEFLPGGGFLWADGLPEARRIDAYARLQRGEVVTSRIDIRDSSGQFHTPGALIHHWVGTVFIPGASLQQVLTLLQDYNHHVECYSPDVVKSKTLEHTGNDFKVYLRLKRKKIVTVVLDTEYDVHYQQLDATRAQSRSYSTRIVEVEHPGETSELQKTPGQDNGFLWRLYSYWRFFETDHGVYVQCEAISLTRDIPAGLNWLIGPFIESIPRESLEFTMRSTRTGVLRGSVHASQ